MQQWNINIGDPQQMAQQIEEQRRQQELLIRQLVNEKQCVVCKNTFLVNDQITMCNFTKECVDNKNGQNCEHWENLYGY